jgi:hypothetical protein
MLKQIYEAINRHHFETVFNIPVLTQGIRSDIPVLISQSYCRNSLDTLLTEYIDISLERNTYIGSGI